ncbi:hypothetical protein MIC97_17100 [Aquamicrobium sp. NLF2-7]|uniref:sigma factor-like helix-turn-helix DNA-binding protein n=1 Tax=Aquamicrobium sp. NLF2-7 TaxID=2918753 RepID=UPI001EFA48A0|nr:sigma factor-like helix-turn-helix DNA-binding protein [Aquamicrobium sp. NLF2-7]MCG8273216.1 hypothetical protein [Aquamicrobium sp. NLF2-7]
MRRIVRNLAIDWTRRLSSECRTVDDKAEYGSIAADRPLPEDALVSRDELRLVMEAMAELLERNRIALMMHRFDGFKLRDIAAPLGISGRTCPRAGL